MTRQRRNRFFRRLALPVLAIGVFAYFGYHTFSGSFGIWAMERLDVDAADLTIQHDQLVAEREALERKVATLKPSSLDADVVDLEARQQLNLMRPDEVVINLGAAQQNPQ
ncbi:MAG TPA: septum formation initiator family protein [Bauldia sp.]|nr:septum formation initiator family protein [Bauldia sp.]